MEKKQQFVIYRDDVYYVGVAAGNDGCYATFKKLL